jgi:hypothetical protein
MSYRLFAAELIKNGFTNTKIDLGGETLTVRGNNTCGMDAVVQCLAIIHSEHPTALPLEKYEENLVVNNFQYFVLLVANFYPCRPPLRHLPVVTLTPLP